MPMLRVINKIFWILALLDILFFIGLATTSMNDDQPNDTIQKLWGIINDAFGFPLILFNRNYPFFLDKSDTSAVTIIAFIVLNNIILTMIIWSIIQGYKALFRRVT